MFTTLFWKDTAERAVKTFLQVVLAGLVVDGVNVANLDWQTTAIGAGTAALISVLTSVVSGQINTADSEPNGPSASLVR